MPKKLLKRDREERLLVLLRQNPLLSDKELSSSLGVSVGTVRLDRALLRVPELRARTREMAERAVTRLRSLKQEEFIGELIDLEPNVRAVSMLNAVKEMAFRHTLQVWDHYIYAQASSLAIATIAEDMVVVDSARMHYSTPVLVGDRLVARAKVGIHKDNKYIVSVHTHAGGREVFVGRFIVVALAPSSFLC